MWKAHKYTLKTFYTKGGILYDNMLEEQTFHSAYFFKVTMLWRICKENRLKCHIAEHLKKSFNNFLGLILNLKCLIFDKT